jgi:hypothetical protein
VGVRVARVVYSNQELESGGPFCEAEFPLGDSWNIVDGALDIVDSGGVVLASFAERTWYFVQTLHVPVDPQSPASSDPSTTGQSSPAPDDTEPGVSPAQSDPVGALTDPGDSAGISQTSQELKRFLPWSVAYEDPAPKWPFGATAPTSTPAPDAAVGPPLVTEPDGNRPAGPTATP